MFEKFRHFKRIIKYQRTSLHRQGMLMLKPDFHSQLFIYTAHVVLTQILISCLRVFGRVPVDSLCSGGFRRSFLPNWLELESDYSSGRQAPTRLDPIGMESGEKSGCYSSFLHNAAMYEIYVATFFFPSLLWTDEIGQCLKEHFTLWYIRVNPILDNSTLGQTLPIIIKSCIHTYYFIIDRSTSLR